MYQITRRYTLEDSKLETYRSPHLMCYIMQYFSNFVRPQPGKSFFFIRRGPGPNKFTRKYLSNFFKFIN